MTPSTEGRRGPMTTSAAFFDRKYAADPDPWKFATDPYERSRYDTVMEHVDPAVHRVVFEPGCSVGVLTEMLGRRCGHVIATDISPLAVQRTRERCADLPGVTARVGSMHPPVGVAFDLAVLSEIGYYHTANQLVDAAADVADAVRSGGRVIALHWLGSSPDHVLHGDEVHCHLAAMLAGWSRVAHGVRPHPERAGFRFDVWDKPPL